MYTQVQYTHISTQYTQNHIHCDFVMAVYNTDGNLTPVLYTRTCFMSHLLVMVSVLVLLQLVLTIQHWHKSRPFF